jgi:hypothetical protein
VLDALVVQQPLAHLGGLVGVHAHLALDLDVAQVVDVEAPEQELGERVELLGHGRMISFAAWSS